MRVKDLERNKKKKRNVEREGKKEREKNGERTSLVFKIMSKKTGLAFKKNGFMPHVVILKHFKGGFGFYIYIKENTCIRKHMHV